MRPAEYIFFEEGEEEEEKVDSRFEPFIKWSRLQRKT